MALAIAVAAFEPGGKGNRRGPGGVIRKVGEWRIRQEQLASSGNDCQLPGEMRAARLYASEAALRGIATQPFANVHDHLFV